MKMSQIICMAMLVLFWGVSTSFGAIQYYGSSSSSARSEATLADAYDDDGDSGTYDVITTVTATYDWSYSIYANTGAAIYGSGGSAGSSFGLATATAANTGLDNKTVSASSYISSELGRDLDSDSDSSSGTATFRNSCGLHFTHSVWTEAGYSGTDPEGKAVGDADAWVSASMQ